MSARILLADDDVSLRYVLSQALAKEGYAVRATGNVSTLAKWVREGEGDLVLSDVYMGDECVFDALPALRVARPNLPFVVMSAQSTVATALSATSAGAFDYVPKPFDLDHLMAVLERALKGEPDAQARARAVLAAKEERLAIIGRSPAMQDVYRAIARVAAGEKVKVAELTRIEDAVLKAVGVAFAPQLGDCPAVRVGFGLPSAELVPVDQGSVMHWGRQTLRAALRYWKPLTVAALFGLGGAAAAKADDAVSEANLKLGGQFGNVIDDYTWQVQGQFTAPVGQDFGLQLEGGGGAVNGHDYYGVGGHLFTRDPDLYLLGLFGAYTEAADLNVKAARAGAECASVSASRV